MKKQRMMVSLAIGVLALGINIAYGALTIPHTFSSGEKAKASEVNANFTAIKQAIDTLNSQVASLTGDSESSGQTYSITPLSANVGDSISVNGISYTIVEADFKSFLDDRHYKIQYPYVASSKNAIYLTVYGGGYLKNKAPNSSLGGYSAYIDQLLNSTHTSTGDGGVARIDGFHQSSIYLGIDANTSITLNYTVYSDAATADVTKNASMVGLIPLDDVIPDKSTRDQTFSDFLTLYGYIKVTPVN